MTSPKTRPEGGPRENPTNFRNGNDLINAAIDASENHRCRTAMIQPQGQAFYLDCRFRSFDDFRPYLDILGKGFDYSNRWLERGFVDHNNRFTLQASSAPRPQSTARFHLGPAVARTLKAVLLIATESSVSGKSGMLAYLLVFEGAAGRAVQKYCVVYTVGEAASIMFHHLANGYSVVFAGIVLKESYHDQHGFRTAKVYQACTSIQEVEAVAASQAEPDKRFSHWGKETIGIIY